MLNGMECADRERLRLEHARAVTDWTIAGGFDPLKERDPAVIGARRIMLAAEDAVVKHRLEHGC